MTKAQTVTVTLPRAVLALINRVLSLPDGVHVVTVVKSSGGAAGLVGWSVAEGPKLEGSKKNRPA